MVTALSADEERERSVAAFRRRVQRLKGQTADEPKEKLIREVTIPETITIQELANRMAERAVDVIKLLMKQGHMAQINDVIDADTAQLIAEEARIYQSSGVDPTQPMRPYRLVRTIEETADVELNDDQRALGTQLIHYALGAIPGALYVFARERIPGVGAARGLIYGALLFIVNDEWLNWRLGFAGSPGSYPTETHMRGLVGHLVLGGTTDVLADIL